MSYHPFNNPFIRIWLFLKKLKKKKINVSQAVQILMRWIIIKRVFLKTRYVPGTGMLTLVNIQVENGKQKVELFQIGCFKTIG